MRSHVDSLPNTERAGSAIPKKGDHYEIFNEFPLKPGIVKYFVLDEALETARVIKRSRLTVKSVLFVLGK